MEISTQLLKPYIEKMESEWEHLYKEVCGHQGDEAAIMKPAIEQRMRQLEKFRTSAMYLDQDKSGANEFPDLRESLRLLKLDLRTTRRRWRRHIVSKIRVQKRQERIDHAASITA